MHLTVFEFDREFVFQCIKPVLCTSVYFAVHLYHQNLLCVLRYTLVLSDICVAKFVSAKPALCTPLYTCTVCVCVADNVYVGQIGFLYRFVHLECSLTPVYSPLSYTQILRRRVLLLSVPHNRGHTRGRRRMRGAFSGPLCCFRSLQSVLSCDQSLGVVGPTLYDYIIIMIFPVTFCDKYWICPS